MSRILDLLKYKYFEWLCDEMCGERYPREISYDLLFRYLHETDFRYLIPRDRDRADDGISLRYRFGLLQRDYSAEFVEDVLDGPCSVLEMIVALAIKFEENVMDNPRMGNRTRQWFWRMMTNLGLGNMTDDNFDERYVEDVVNRFLNREYHPDGHGGLFVIRNCEYDLTTVDIWSQLCWYSNTIDDI